MIFVYTIIALILYIHYRSNEQELICSTILTFPLLLLLLSLLPYANITIPLLIYLYKFNLSLIPLVLKAQPSSLRNDITNFVQSQFVFHHNFECLPDYPTIIVSNYCFDRLENIFCILIPKDLSIVLGELMIKRAYLHRYIDNYIIVNSEKSEYQNVKNQVLEQYKQKRSIFAYVTKCPQKSFYIRPCRSGMFRIAQELNIPITPIAFDYIHSFCGIVPKQRYEIKVGKTFKVENIDVDTRNVHKFFRQSWKEFEKRKFS